MARTKADENTRDPATGRPLPSGVTYLGPARYRARKLIDGSRTGKVFDTARLAREWLEATAVAVRAGDYVDQRPLDQLILRDLVQRYVDEEMVIGGRRRGAAEDLGHVPSILNDAIGGLSLAKLTSAAVRGFRDRQAATLSAATVVKRLNLLAAIINHGISEWDIPMRSNPASASSVKRPEGADVKRDRRLLPPTADQVREAQEKGEDALSEEARLLAAVAKGEFPDDVVITRLAIAQAARQGELLALLWEDIDFDRGLLTVRGRHGRGTKAGERKQAVSKERVGWEIRPLMPEAAALLLAHRGDKRPNGSDAIFSIGNANSFKVRIGRAITRAQLADLTFHDLRHEATSRLAVRYPNPMDLKRVTGHRDLKSLDRYYNPDLTELARRGIE